MTRAELTEKILGIKREKGWSWKHICDEIGGMSPVLVTGAMLGQMKLTKPQAAKAAELFGLSKSEQALLNEVPYRGSQMPPTDPLIYRFYELVMVNGPAWKALSRKSSATVSCRPSISTCRSSACPIRRAIASS
jgi:cyanate lyase